jgi:hypothetical protein
MTGSYFQCVSREGIIVVGEIVTNYYFPTGIATLAYCLGYGLD